LKQALDFEQLGEDGVALIIAATVDVRLECGQGFLGVPHQLPNSSSQLDSLSTKSTVSPHAIPFTAWRAWREAAVDSAAAVRHCW
jgi:hypothetical protein